jgi:hypothetical protein
MRNGSLLALVACGALILNAQTPGCTTSQVPGAMTSWSGQPGTQDHLETQTVSQGTVLACEAVDAPGSALPAGCHLSLDKGGQFTVPSHQVIRLSKDGPVTLSCNGPFPNCCRVQLTEDKSPLKRGDAKPHKPEASK